MSAGVGRATLKRRLAIIDAVRRLGFARTETLAELFDVSSVTIRSDLAYLQNQNLVIRVNGGARPCLDRMPVSSGDEPTDIAGCHALARQAARRIGAGQTVFLDNSRASSLVPLHALSGALRFLVNGLDSFHLASRSCDSTIALLGGSYDRQGLPVGDPAARQALSFYEIDLAILAVSHVTEDRVVCLDRSGNCLEAACGQAERVLLLHVPDGRASEGGPVIGRDARMEVIGRDAREGITGRDAREENPGSRSAVFCTE